MIRVVIAELRKLRRPSLLLGTIATVGGLRHIVFNADKMGFKTAIKRIGARVLIDEKEFFKCVEKINEVQSA